MRRILIVLVVLITTSASSSDLKAQFSIDINFSGDAQFEQAINDAAAIWENLFSGYQNGVVAARTGGSSYIIGQTVDTIFIDASIAPIDGLGGTLGFGGFQERVVDQAGFSLSTDGIISFDSADVAGFSDDFLELIIVHEIGHVMGFGTQWINNGVYVNNTGEYQGALATAKWQSEFGQTGTPDVELGGGTGTANGHWNEVDLGAGLTGITDSMGRDMRNEVMTGWANPEPYFISEMTIASFEDIGFVAVPEPSSAAIVGLIFVAGLNRRRRL